MQFCHQVSPVGWLVPTANTRGQPPTQAGKEPTEHYHWWLPPTCIIDWCVRQAGTTKPAICFWTREQSRYLMVGGLFRLVGEHVLYRLSVSGLLRVVHCSGATEGSCSSTCTHVTPHVSSLTDHATMVRDIYSWTQVPFKLMVVCPVLIYFYFHLFYGNIHKCNVFFFSP